MSSVNLLTGLSTGRFDTLKVKNPLTGEYEALLPSTASNNLLQIYVHGVLYPNVTRLNFTNIVHLMDSVSGTLNIGQQLYQSYLRIASETAQSELTRGNGGELLWDGAAMQSALNGGSDVALNVGRGVVMLENNQYDNAVGAGVTLRALVNPSSQGSMLAVRSAGGACRFWVGQNITTTGFNDFHCCGNGIIGQEHDPAGYLHSFTNSQVTIGTPLVVNGPLTTQHYSETSSATTTLAQGQDTLTPISLHIAWGLEGGAYTNVAGSHQELTLPHLGIGYFNHPAGTKVYLSVDLKAGSLTEVVFATHDIFRYDHVSRAVGNDMDELHVVFYRDCSGRICLWNRKNPLKPGCQ
jgi:hypothetical protein